MAEPLADADAEQWRKIITPDRVLSQIGSPFAPDHRSTSGGELDPVA